MALFGFDTEGLLERSRDSWDALSGRERRLVAALGAVLALTLLLLPLLLAWNAVAAIDDENAAIRAALHQMESRGDDLARLQAERQAVERKLNRRVPALGSFVDQKARSKGLTLGPVTDEPDQQDGSFVRKSIRVKLDKVDLGSLVNFIHAIEESNYPVAVSYLKVEHYQAGDTYNADLGVVAYERRSSSGEG